MDKIIKQFPILSRKKTTDIFLNIDTITNSKKLKIENFIRTAKKFNIMIHISILTFFDGQKFINPIKNEVKYSCFMNEIIKKSKIFYIIKKYSRNSFWLKRYPGNAYKYNGGINVINSFVKQAVTELKIKNKNLIISVMTKTTKIKKYYDKILNLWVNILMLLFLLLIKGIIRKN